MTLAEDLLLIAVGPRDGLIRAVERIEVALRAMELVELAQAGRIGVDGRRITVIDPEPLGHPRLDRALASLQDGSQIPTLGGWLLQRRPGPGLINQYLSLLVRQGVIRVEYRDLAPAMFTWIVILDQQRRARARGGIDLLARQRDGSAVTAGERALAVVVHTCGLDRHLYRGLRGGSARSRLARLTDQRRFTEDARAVIDAADGTAELTDHLPDLMRRVYRIQQEERADGYHVAAGGHPGPAGADGGRRVRIVEADGFTARHAVISMRTQDSPLRFVLIPMAHVAIPGFYQQVRRRLSTCDLIVAEGIRGRTWQIRTLTTAYRLVPYRRRHGLVLQDTGALLPPGVPVLNPDVTAAEATRDLRALGRRLYLPLLIAAPIVGLILAIRGPRAILRRNIDATQPSTIADAGALMPNDDPDSDPDPGSGSGSGSGSDAIEHALRARRDRQLLAAIDDICDQHHDEPLIVAVVYGAAHIPEVYAHLFARHGYRPGEPEWFTALSVPANWI